MKSLSCCFGYPNIQRIPLLYLYCYNLQKHLTLYTYIYKYIYTHLTPTFNILIVLSSPFCVSRAMQNVCMCSVHTYLAYKADSDCCSNIIFFHPIDLLRFVYLRVDLQNIFLCMTTSMYLGSVCV